MSKRQYMQKRPSKAKKLIRTNRDHPYQQVFSRSTFLPDGRVIMSQGDFEYLIETALNKGIEIEKKVTHEMIIPYVQAMTELRHEFGQVLIYAEDYPQRELKKMLHGCMDSIAGLYTQLWTLSEGSPEAREYLESHWAERVEKIQIGIKRATIDNDGGEYLRGLAGIRFQAGFERLNELYRELENAQIKKGKRRYRGISPIARYVGQWWEDIEHGQTAIERINSLKHHLESIPDEDISPTERAILEEIWGRVNDEDSLAKWGLDQHYAFINRGLRT